MENCKTPTLRVLVVEPLRAPYSRELPDTLEEMQKLVGGTIQAIYPFDEPVALICHDEGKLLGLPPNRALRDENGVLYDIVCGTFFLCAAPPDSDSFESLNEEQLERYAARFRPLELFLAKEREL
ncbi:DUF3846 domain-containing protein [Clostridium sp. J1101437_171009_A5]|uniref:DUF3846 domain-containing protein n=1 Tax=Clostridium sp. J1101437_171009_A5 TaxID=2787098 RepID=UPI001898ADF1|nr:DUF3846 domain-containing protein [Clostridium sp. J1101437_171009_A5]